MKKIILPLFFALLILFCGGCHSSNKQPDIVATTLPVYEFTTRLCTGTGLTVEHLISDNVSCLHDYSLTVGQMEKIEGANLVVLNGGGLEDFMEDSLQSAGRIVYASDISAEHSHHDHEHHTDTHIWLSPIHAHMMAQKICSGLCKSYPQYTDTFQRNLTSLLNDLAELQHYGEQKLNNLSCKKLITFHDGFCSFAESFDLEILRAVEEEAGSEASAKDLIELIELVKANQVPAIFIETNGSDAAARIIAAETGAEIYVLDMAISGDSYFDSMYRNINTIWEALQ